MKSRIRTNDENNVYVESKKMKTLKAMQSYNEYLKKVSTIQKAVKGELDEAYSIPEGTKVKLNYESIINEPDYPKKKDRYKEFVENNKDKVFTVVYDEKYKNNPVLVSLEEDTNEVKWLWYCETDLIVIDSDD